MPSAPTTSSGKRTCDWRRSAVRTTTHARAGFRCACAVARPASVCRRQRAASPRMRRGCSCAFSLARAIIHLYLCTFSLVSRFALIANCRGRTSGVHKGVHTQPLLLLLLPVVVVFMALPREAPLLRPFSVTRSLRLPAVSHQSGVMKAFTRFPTAIITMLEQIDSLPRAEHQAPATNRHGERRANQRGLCPHARQRELHARGSGVCRVQHPH